KLRGPGDIEGTQQSGLGFDLKIANLAKDGEILQLARNKASEILKEDPGLQKPENMLLLKQILTSKTTEFNWGAIS
ncbi:MAG: ATP-dependent DNA helicase RecG, partial [Prolixibacteraceae bacterium]|nr:ATP-dependent DNA helicase RecG [Prolixibacteraceae bacterium]